MLEIKSKRSAGRSYQKHASLKIYEIELAGKFANAGITCESELVSFLSQAIDRLPNPEHAREQLESGNLINILESFGAISSCFRLD